MLDLDPVLENIL